MFDVSQFTGSIRAHINDLCNVLETKSRLLDARNADVERLADINAKLTKQVKELTDKLNKSDSYARKVPEQFVDSSSPTDDLIGKIRSLLADYSVKWRF